RSDVVLVWIVNSAEHVLEGDGHARDAMVLEDRKIDDRITNLGKSAREKASHTPKHSELIFITQSVVSEASNSRASFDDPEPCALKVCVQAIPDHNIFDADLLETLRDCFDEFHPGGVAFPGKAIDFQTHHFAGSHDAPPRVRRRVAIKESLHRAVKHLKQPGRVQSGG